MTDGPSGSAQVLRIASYNVHRCIGLDGRRDVGRVAQVIRELDADVVGLQEVDNQPGPHQDSMQLDYLAHATDMRGIPGLTMVRGAGHYGNALLTRRRVTAVRRHDFSYRRYEPRGALDVEVEAGGTTLRVIVTHLGLVAGERRHQVERLLELLDQRPRSQPVVLLGDLNEWLPIGRPLRRLHALLGEAPAVRTFPVCLPMFALDRIWVRPRTALCEFAAHRSPLARRASDHYPVKAVLRVE